MNKTNDEFLTFFDILTEEDLMHMLIIECHFCCENGNVSEPIDFDMNGETFTICSRCRENPALKNIFHYFEKTLDSMKNKPNH